MITTEFRSYRAPCRIRLAAVITGAAIAIAGAETHAAELMRSALAPPIGDRISVGEQPKLSQGNELTIGVGDKLSIWVHMRQDLTGEYKVRIDGKLAIPMIGTIMADGRTIADIERDLTQSLERSGNIAPLLSVDVSEWRPIYIVGSVDKPGTFVFRPGMTALHALALAGGLYRPPIGTAAIEASRETWQLRQTRGKLKLALARQARLEAEQQNKPNIDIPEALVRLAEPGESEIMIRSELRAMQQRERAFENLISSNNRGVELAELELKALEGELDQVQEQIRLTQNDINQIGDLVKSGLTTQVRVNELRRAAANLEAEKRRIQGNKVRIQQTVNISSKERRQIEIDKGIKLEEELNSVRDEIRALEVAASAAEEAVHYLTGSRVREVGSRDAAIIYSVTRNEGGAPGSRQITESTELRPGDIIRISVASPRS